MSKTKFTKSNATELIKGIEKTLLGIIALLTLIATGQEILSIYNVGTINLADLLLLFIYTEVLGMIGVFYASSRIPITLPLFIPIPAFIGTLPFFTLLSLNFFNESTIPIAV